MKSIRVLSFVAPDRHASFRILAVVLTVLSMMVLVSVAPVRADNLRVMKTGLGAGTITATGISCGSSGLSDCNETYGAAASVIRSAYRPSTQPRAAGQRFRSGQPCVRTGGGDVMRVTLPAVIAALCLVSPVGAAAQTPSAPKPATDVYHVHLTKAVPGQAVALGKDLSQPDPTAAMPDHFVVLRHQEGDDWDYAVIQHLGQKPTVAVTPPPAAAAADLRVSHTDTFVSGPSWADFTREMGIGGAGKPGAVYVLGFHRAVPGHRTQLAEALSQPAAAGAKIQTGAVVLQHIEGSDWQFLTITRYNSWQDFGMDRAAAAADASAAGGWADVRQHSASHRDTIADRVHPVK